MIGGELSIALGDGRVYPSGMEINLEDSTPIGMESTPTANNGDLSCEICGTELTYAGRGRKPRFCAKHRPNSSRSTSTPSKKITSVDGLVSNIADFYSTIGVGLTLYGPTAFDGMQVASNSDKLAESWRKVLETNPSIRKYWEKVFTAGSYGVLISTHLMVLMPIMQHHGIVPGAATTPVKVADNE